MAKVARSTNSSALLHPITKQYLAHRHGTEIAVDDVLVKAYPWAFEIIDVQTEKPESPKSVVVESARANPGEKRNTKR